MNLPTVECVVIAIILSLLVIIGCPKVAKARTMYQTNIDSYEPRIDLRTDTVLLHEHGKGLNQIQRSISSWQNAVGDVYMMWFVGSDANKLYVDGRIDGIEHYGEIETGRDGNGFWCGPHRPYMVPTEKWIQYMEDLARLGVKSGVSGVSPEEPLAHTGAGYSPAFKQEWQSFYGEGWSSPSSSVNAFWKASKLKSYLYLNCVERVAKATKDYVAAEDCDVKFVLPIHSLVSHAAGNMIYPNGQTYYLGEVDGFIGQVWTGPVGWSLPRYEGRQFTRNRGFFESAWILYSSFANLVRQSEKRMYLLADPVEDDPNYKWEEYHIWYNQCLVSKLMFPWVADYEVMPWPDRIFLPGYGTGGGSPGPAKYLTQLMVNIAVLDDMENQEGVSWDCGTMGIGVLVGDTLAWQRGGPSGSSMDSLNGLVVPLLRKGIPVQIVPIERSYDEGYLNDFDLLLLSYDMWKPLDPAYHDALDSWVRKGGVLIFFEGDDPYNAVDEWWRRKGYAAPGEHLLATLGLDVQFQLQRAGERPASIISAAGSEKKSIFGRIGGWFSEVFTQPHTKLLKHTDEVLQPIIKPMIDGIPRKRMSMPDVTYCMRNDAQLRSVFVEAIGKGHLVYVGIPSETFAGSSLAAEVLRNLVKYCMNELVGGEYRESDYMVVERGDYVIVRGIEGGTSLKGDFIDLLSSNIPLLDGVTIPAEASALLFDASSLMKSAEPTVIYGSHEVIDSMNCGNQTVIVSAGPWQTRGVVRVFAGNGYAGDTDSLRVEAFVIGDVGSPVYEIGYSQGMEAVKGFPTWRLTEVWPRWQSHKVDYAKLVEQADTGLLRKADVRWEWDKQTCTLLLDFEQWHSGVLIVVHW